MAVLKIVWGRRYVKGILELGDGAKGALLFKSKRGDLNTFETWVQFFNTEIELMEGDTIEHFGDIPEFLLDISISSSEV